jgi:YcxB-like protein
MTLLMHVDYGVSEKDFFQAQKLAIKKSPVRLVSSTRWAVPLIGAITLAYLAYAIVTQGFAINMVLGAIPPLGMISLPLLTRRTQKKLYAQARHFHGPMSLDTDDYGMTIKGDGVDARIAWSNLLSFHEDDNSFIIYSSSAVFHPVPKRTLSEEQVAGLRECFQRNIRKR